MSRKLELTLSVGLLLGAADVARPADVPSTQTLIEQATHGDAAALISAEDLKHYWRSDHYGALSHNVLSRPAIVVDLAN
jgi:hypothetical protein